MPLLLASQQLRANSLVLHRLLLGLLVGIENTLLDQFVSSRTSLQFLLKSIGPHLLVKGFLIGLDARCSGRVRKNVAWKGIS